MKLIIVENYEEMSKVGAEVLASTIRQSPTGVLGLATGSTPLLTYDLLAQMCKCKELSFKDIHTVNLDEYRGLDSKNVNSYAYFMRKNLFDKVDINLANTHLPSGLGDEQAACENYTKLLKDNVQDVQLLGLGSDGHIGFNEPLSPFQGHTHVVKLAQSTLKDNARLFEHPEDVPHYAITMGIADIMQAKQILLLASGANKAQAVYDMVKGKVNENCPASILQTHSNAIVVLDKQAASRL